MAFVLPNAAEHSLPLTSVNAKSNPRFIRIELSSGQHIFLKPDGGHANPAVAKCQNNSPTERSIDTTHIIRSAWLTLSATKKERLRNTMDIIRLNAQRREIERGFLVVLLYSEML